MSLYFGTTEITGLHFGDTEITGLYFGDTEIWAAWAEYDGTLPATYTANGSALADYRVYGAAGGVGDDSGTAYGYEVDMSVSDGAATATTPIYIGPSSLGEDEYISYSEQKIYKRTENLCPPQDFGTWNLGYIDPAGNLAAQTNAKEISSDYIAVSGDQTCNFKNFRSFPSGSAGSWYAMGIYDANKNFISRPASPQYGVNNNNLKYILPSNAAYVRLTFRAYDTIDNQLSFTFGNDPPAQFIPYIIPTDPPVPLPALPTVDGVTITDYAGQSVAVPSRFYAKYRKG